MRVTLNSETPSRDCGCASLLEHWESATHQKAVVCSVVNCKTPASDAAVVTVMDEAGTLRYVAPVCHWHARLEDFNTDLHDGSQLVPRSLLATCTYAVSASAAT